MQSNICNTVSSNFGQLNYASGRYEGSIVNGNKEGFGTFCYISGSRYVGEWKNDKKHGKGIKNTFFNMFIKLF